MAVFLQRVFTLDSAVFFIVAFGVIGTTLTILLSLQSRRMLVIPDHRYCEQV